MDVQIRRLVLVTIFGLLIGIGAVYAQGTVVCQGDDKNGEKIEIRPLRTSYADQYLVRTSQGRTKAVTEDQVGRGVVSSQEINLDLPNGRIVGSARPDQGLRVDVIVDREKTTQVTCQVIPELKSGSFKLYQRDTYARSGCELGAVLTLDRAEITGRVGFMSDFAEGSCEIVLPRPGRDDRFYPVLASMDECGSIIYRGARIARDGTYQIVITDNRARRCKDSKDGVVANIVAFEIYPNKFVRKLYSQDLAVEQKPEKR